MLSQLLEKVRLYLNNGDLEQFREHLRAERNSGKGVREGGGLAVSRDWQKDWELCEKATPKPWRAEPYAWRVEPVCDHVRPADAYFIAEAHEALPYWLQRVRELEAQAAAMREALEDLAGSPPVFDDERLDYVEVQVPRASLEFAREVLASDAGHDLLDRVEKLERVAEAARPAAKALQFWLVEGDLLCECEGQTHICGYTERLNELKALEQALAALDGDPK